MRIKGAIFDLDGTLIDSMPLWRNLGARYLRLKGLTDIPQDLDERLKTMSFSQAAHYFQCEYGINETEMEIIDGVNRLIMQGYREEVPLKAFVRPFLEKLKENGVKMCIATATEKPLALAALRRLDIEAYFSDIITCSEIGLGKDQPDFFPKALESLGTPVQDTVVFEDSLHAALSAKNAGFIVVGVFDESGRKDKEKMKAFVHCYLDSFDQCEMEEL